MDFAFRLRLSLTFPQIYNNVVLAVIAVPLAILLSNIPGGQLVIEVAIIFLAFTSTMCIMFFKSWHHILARFFAFSDFTLTCSYVSSSLSPSKLNCLAHPQWPQELFPTPGPPRILAIPQLLQLTPLLLPLPPKLRERRTFKWSKYNIFRFVYICCNFIKLP